MPDNGDTTPLETTGMLRFSGLDGSMCSGKPGMLMRFAMLWYDAGSIWQNVSLPKTSDSKGRTHLYDLIPRELEEWYIGSIARHQIAIEHPKDGLVCNNQEVV